MMPKTANEMKLMSFGKILDNKKTVGQCKLPLVDISGGIIMMRVVGHPAMEKANTGKMQWRAFSRSQIQRIVLDHQSIRTTNVPPLY
ncbi:hypothetical protein ACFX2I_029396 [Malus domestica]